MYDELIKRLRDAAKMSDALAVLLPHSEGNETAKLYREAADALEELSILAENGETAYDIIVRQTSYIEELQKKIPRWIPVDERLPEQGKRYLVIRFDEVTKTQFIDILWHDAHDLWWNRLYKGQYNVTHWMQLPELPKEE